MPKYNVIAKALGISPNTLTARLKGKGADKLQQTLDILDYKLQIVEYKKRP